MSSRRYYGLSCLLLFLLALVGGGAVFSMIDGNPNVIITPSIFTTDGSMPITIQFLNNTINYTYLVEEYQNTTINCTVNETVYYNVTYNDTTYYNVTFNQTVDNGTANVTEYYNVTYNTTNYWNVTENTTVEVPSTCNITILVNVSYPASYDSPATGDYIYLYAGATCSAAPVPAASAPDQVTTMATVTNGTGVEQIDTDISALSNGTYQVCYATAATGTYPTDFNSIGEVKILHSIYMSPNSLNIDQKNVTVTMSHVTTGYSIYLLLTVADGVPTDLGCRDIAPGGAVETDTTRRTEVALISGSSTVDLNITGLTAGEYQICISDGVFVDTATTAFLSLPTRAHLFRSKLCTGGGTTGICLVSPTYTDKRLNTQKFYLYPARPKSYGYLLRKDVCGAATHYCDTTAHASVTAGYASPIARVGFDRMIDIDMTGLVPGSYVFCALNITADSVPGTAVYHEVTAATISVADGIDPSQTVVSCCGGSNTFVAGTDHWCTVYTYDLAGSPAGIVADTCSLVGQVKDKNGGSVCNTSPLYWRDVGRFEFKFVPTLAGLTSSTVAHFNMSSTSSSSNSQTVAYSGIGAVVNVTAAGFDETNSISTCAKNAGVDECLITNRDQYGNVVGYCVHRSDDSFYCNGASFP